MTVLSAKFYCCFKTSRMESNTKIAWNAAFKVNFDEHKAPINPYIGFHEKVPRKTIEYNAVYLRHLQKLTGSFIHVCHNFDEKPYLFLKYVHLPVEFGDTDDVFCVKSQEWITGFAELSAFLSKNMIYVFEHSPQKLELFLCKNKVDYETCKNSFYVLKLGEVYEKRLCKDCSSKCTEN